MVVFTCNSCGDSLQKPRVEKHFYKCRGPKSLTCVDCLKDFRGEEYSAHTKCLTEDERYSAKGTFPKGVVNKGEAKQSQWTEMIRNIVDKETGLAQSARNLLKTIATYENVPRKKVKFINFVKSSSGGRVHLIDVETAWDVIEKHKNDNTADPTKIISQKRPNEDIPEEPEKKKPKIKDEQQEALITSTVDNSNGVNVEEKFSFKDKIIDILTKKHTISMGKLQKKVMNAYKKSTGNQDITEKLIKKYNKKLKKIENIVIENDTVSLIES